ncbi:carboxylesterase/lipase family protein [Phenylobacterium sp.]|uniref:carboxylesterase/lipase family protein n=1 Tax=Phenylobacterium sp. TaxID=1871053 RepID=UPI003BA8AAE8
MGDHEDLPMMIWKTALAAAVSLLFAASALAAAPTARTETGVVRGVTTGEVSAYLGLPYAAPPIGPLRWRPPQPAKPWSSLRPATSFAPACLQTGVSMPGETPPKTSEDCLYLNVWAPAHPPEGGAAVIVWIHGGGYANGATAMPLYAGDRLARKGVVVVSLAYRLGPLGFLAHPALSAEGGGTSGNYGLMDQIAALEWVHRNIAAFGGDPGNVTIAGQSAGAMSVSLLMASPRAKGLFQRAIGQSGGVFEPLQLAPGYQLPQAEKDGVGYAASVGAKSLADLRALPAERLLGGGTGKVTHPVIEPAVLPRSPYDAFVAGRQNSVPILVGYNAEEARSLADVSKVSAATFAADLSRAWGPLPPGIVAAYPFTTDDEARHARIALETDLRFGWDMWAWARLQAKAGQPVYFYRFDRAPPFPAGTRAGWGASHFAELWYMFDQLDQEPWAWTPADRRLADAMSSYWVNFARTGNPNGQNLPSWPAFTLAQGNMLSLGDSIVASQPPVPAPIQAFDATYGAVRGKPFGR